MMQGWGSKRHHIACLASLVLCQRLFALLSGEFFSWGSGDDDDEWWRRLLRWCGRQAVGAEEARRPPTGS